MTASSSSPARWIACKSKHKVRKKKRPGVLKRSGAWPPAGSKVEGSALEIGPLLLDDGANALAEQGYIKRLLEPFAEAVIGQPFRVGLVFAGQRHDHRLLVLRIAAQVRGDLQGLAAAH